MQSDNSNKKLLFNSLAKTLKELRGEKSQFRFSMENDIPIDVISKCERGIKNPQLTTLYKIAEAGNISFEELAHRISINLPKDFTLIDK